jgi:hypothetical protein
VRGLSVVLSTVTRWLEVFPPCAGVIGLFPHPAGWKYSPACGGYRRCCPWKYSPACGGYGSIPPHAGVIGRKVFPRMRGLSVTFFNVFPPHAGGNPRSILPAWGYRRKPMYSPVCGGYRPRLSKAKLYSPACGGYRTGFGGIPPHAGVIGGNAM